MSICRLLGGTRLSDNYVIFSINFRQNGIQPTFCVYNSFGTTLVCCLDGSSILQRGSPNIDDRPIWGSSSSSKRVSERKCEEYSRGVVERVDYIPLLPDPEPFTITAAKCDYTGVELIVGGENAVQGEFPHMVSTGGDGRNYPAFSPVTATTVSQDRGYAFMTLSGEGRRVFGSLNSQRN
ncbi:hypothetical protein O3G_MSEX014068 [Manduca sexta]|uniref:Uncharacterized protein n=1 Tax=Manduca sexta TaxID=7130 RepID=A0A921ZTU5_MANSE|nr:hypothetical protein O3G_MSEX014068 [Manduca sexta]